MRIIPSLVITISLFAHVTVLAAPVPQPTVAERCLALLQQAGSLVCGSRPGPLNNAEPFVAEPVQPHPEIIPFVGQPSAKPHPKPVPSVGQPSKLKPVPPAGQPSAKPHPKPVPSVAQPSKLKPVPSVGQPYDPSRDKDLPPIPAEHTSPPARNPKHQNTVTTYFSDTETAFGDNPPGKKGSKDSSIEQPGPSGSGGLVVTNPPVSGTHIDPGPSVNGGNERPPKARLNRSKLGAIHEPSKRS